MDFQSGVSLKPFNTLRLQAQAKALCSVASEAELGAALDRARVDGMKVIILGEGSNVVFAADQESLILRQQTRGIEVIRDDDSSVSLRAAAGENWHHFVQWTLQEGYSGLENLALIPGTVGASPIQNVGAYGVEVCEYIDRVHALDIATGKRVELRGEECAFAYRDSVLKQGMRDKLVITAVDFTLPRGAPPACDYPALRDSLEARGLSDPSPQQVFDAVVDIRRSKLPDPAVEPNAGSFFKNPVLTEGAARELVQQFPGLPHFPQADGNCKLAAAWLIEHCGWKGTRRAGVGVHTDHALVLLNCGSDDGLALLQLADDIARDVTAVFGIDLAIEPRVYR